MSTTCGHPFVSMYEPETRGGKLMCGQCTRDFDDAEKTRKHKERVDSMSTLSALLWCEEHHALIHFSETGDVSVSVLPSGMSVTSKNFVSSVLSLAQRVQAYELNQA